MSSILANIIEKKESQWNRYVWVINDIDRLSQKFIVPVIEDASAKAKGEYTMLDKKPVILLKPGLKQQIKLWVALHEFGHHLLHYPVNHKFSKWTRRRMDREANFFAAIALIPTYLIEENFLNGMSIREALGIIAEEFGYPKELLKIRQEIYETYKI